MKFNLKNTKLFLFISFCITYCFNYLKVSKGKDKLERFCNVQTCFSDVAEFIGFQDAVKTGIISQRINVDYSEELYSDRPSVGGIFTILNELRKRSKQALTSTVRGFEQREAPDIIITNGAVNPATDLNNPEVTFVLKSTPRYINACHKDQTVKLLINVTTGYSAEGVITYVDVATNTIKIKSIDAAKYLGKGAVGTYGAIPDATRILITGNVNQENAGANDQPTILPSPVSNELQTIRDNYALSLEVQKQRMYGQNERTRLLESCRYRHQKNLPKTLLFNGSSSNVVQTATSTTQIRYAAGIERQILDNSPKNVEYENAEDFYDAFDQFQFGLFDPMLVDGGQWVRFLGGNKAMRKFFTDLKRDKPGIEITDHPGYNTEFGISGVQKIKTDAGEFHLYVDPLIQQVYPNIDEPYGMALHLNYIEIKMMQDTMLRANIQNPDVLGAKDEFVTILSNLLYLPELHGIIRKEFAY